MVENRKETGLARRRSEGAAFALIGVVTALVLYLIGSAIYPRLPGPRPEGSGRVDAQAALHEVSSGSVQVVDARETAEYLAGHLPGAVSIPVSALRDEAYGTTVPIDEAAALFDAAGVHPDRPVLVYADQLADAAYVAWVLVSLGAERVRLLDGGIAAWQAAGGEIVASSAGERRSQSGTGGAGPWSARVASRWPSGRVLDLIDLYSVIDSPDIVLVDTRAAGERDEAIAGGANPEADHHVAWTELVTEDGRSFKNKMVLHRVLQALPARRQLVVYGDGTTASALVWWSLYEHGYAKVARFDESFASWQEMGFPTRPVTSGGGGQQSSPRIGGGCG